ncbi:MAG: family 10 glycosylhydrolase [Hamadaea sp.]|uniref:glycoside hydrolase family 10 protein n=1 Tax=Hamadaea sp. TaxID=2024425 RepID=UPI0018072229|nr:family 10 glycosylhydrolase [Hamadaea sp.]NUR73972.1 family 10 glycosylhydrolase [Hamadaea sp.]NUT22381.1 family 10 glycosylhydrolase [Hamadaea sp.]
MSPSLPRRTFTALALAAPLTAALPGVAFAEEPSTLAGAPDPFPVPDTSSCEVDPATPKREFRAMWIASVVNIDWPRAAGLDEQSLKADYRAWLDLAEKLNHNAVVVQIRPTADAFWPSAYEPWSEWLTGKRDGVGPGWDPVAWMVAETHARNLEFHAWFNPYRVSMPAVSGGAGGDVTKLAPNHPVQQHPDWAVAYPVGNASTRLYYNPGIPEVRAFVQDAIMDAVTKYDLDGVHFDDYFYPYPASGQDFGDEATFAAHGAGWATKADWRRNNIDLLIQEMSQKVREAKPWVKFGVSPFGIWRNKAADPLGSETNGTQSYDANFADTRKWVKEGWLDYIVPQVYWNIGFAVADYGKLVPWWADVVAGTQCQLYIGQADYKISAAGQPAAWFDPAEMGKHIALNRSLPEVDGSIHFSAKDVKANRLGATDLYAAAYYSRPSLPPALERVAAKPMIPPVITHLRREAGGVRLQWLAPGNEGRPFDDPTSFAIYRYEGRDPLPEPCDLADAALLVGTVRGTSYLDTTAVAGTAYTYVVTALDRVWHESAPGIGRFTIN